MIAFFLGTFFGFTIAAIFSARAYDKGYKDAKGGANDGTIGS
jgi:hypothetical protein